MIVVAKAGAGALGFHLPVEAVARGMSDYKVKFDVFEGPLDLLLYLIKENEVEITVTNHGKGIDPEDLPRIFGRFTRSKSAPGSGVRGLGLGLYIARGVVKAHGGRMWAESIPGKTTTFHVTLPTAVAKQEAA